MSKNPSPPVTCHGNTGSEMSKGTGAKIATFFVLSWTNDPYSLDADRYCANYLNINIIFCFSLLGRPNHYDRVCTGLR